MRTGNATVTDMGGQEVWDVVVIPLHAAKEKGGCDAMGDWVAPDRLAIPGIYAQQQRALGCSTRRLTNRTAEEGWGRGG
jgi:hypothetical protein